MIQRLLHLPAYTGDLWNDCFYKKSHGRLCKQHHPQLTQQRTMKVA